MEKKESKGSESISQENLRKRGLIELFEEACFYPGAVEAKRVAKELQAAGALGLYGHFIESKVSTTLEDETEINHPGLYTFAKEKVKKAKKDCKQFQHLPDEALIPLSLYSYGPYGKFLNKIHCDPRSVTREEIEQYRIFVLSLVRGFRFLFPCLETVYRAGAMNAKDFRIGAVVTFPLWISSSKSKQKAEMYLPHDSRLLLTIRKVKTGRSLEHLSLGADEQEVIFRPFTSFRVISVTKRETFWEVELEEMYPPELICVADTKVKTQKAGSSGLEPSLRSMQITPKDDVWQAIPDRKIIWTLPRVLEESGLAQSSIVDFSVAGISSLRDLLSLSRQELSESYLKLRLTSGEQERLGSVLARVKFTRGCEESNGGTVVQNGEYLILTREDSKPQVVTIVGQEKKAPQYWSSSAVKAALPLSSASEDEKDDDAEMGVCETSSPTAASPREEGGESDEMEESGSEEEEDTQVKSKQIPQRKKSESISASLPMSASKQETEKKSDPLLEQFKRQFTGEKVPTLSPEQIKEAWQLDIFLAAKYYREAIDHLNKEEWGKAYEALNQYKIHVESGKRTFIKDERDDRYLYYLAYLHQESNKRGHFSKGGSRSAPTNYHIEEYFHYIRKYPPTAESFSTQMPAFMSRVFRKLAF